MLVRCLSWHLKSNRSLSSLIRATACCLATAAMLFSQAAAAPVAYWRFGDDGATPVDGNFLTPTAGRTAIETDPTFFPGIDSTGNGNTLYTWDTGGIGQIYRADVPSATVGGNPNIFSIQNSGGIPTAFTWSFQSSPVVDLETISPATWTIEASVKPEIVDGQFRTFVGRDGTGVSTGDGNLAPLYFQMNNQNQFRINYTDVAGNTHIVDAPGIQIHEHQWYHVAATSDGSTLSLYVDQFDGTGYQLAGTADLTGSANSALVFDSDGATYDPNTPFDPNDTQWNWSLGRGRYGASEGINDNHGDRFYGHIDEVRISDNAVAPNSFLFAGQNLNHGPRLEVNRDTGAFTLVNLQASLDLVGYFIESPSGALDPDAWFSVTGNQDSTAGNPGSFDPDGFWIFVEGTNNRLEEITFDDGGALGSVELGLANAWTRSRYEDLEMTIDQLLPDLSVKSFSVPVVFIGGNGQTAGRSDLDLDGDVDRSDWNLFAANHLTDLSGLTVAAASVLGDIDGDLDNDLADFRLFQTDYDEVNGLGALAQLIASVPEPSTGVLMILAGIASLGTRRRPSNPSRISNTKHTTKDPLMSNSKTLQGVFAVCVAVMAGLLMCSSEAHAVSINWNADNNGTIGGDGAGSLPPVSAQAGVLLTGGWTNDWPDYDYTDLRDSLGNPTTLDITPFSNSGTWNINGFAHRGQDSNGTWNNELLTGYLNSGAPTGAGGAGVVLTDIPYSLYDIYVYFNSDVDTRTGTVNVGASTYAFKAAGAAGSFGGDGNATFFEATALTTSSDTANYAVFSGLTGASQTITVDIPEFGGLAGFQLVESDQPFIPDLVAEVNKTTGEIVIRNTSDAPVTFDYYLIESAGGALSTGGWNSLESQGYDVGNGIREADFNLSTTVDGVDLAQWEGDYGSNGDSDADGDGLSTGSDFLIWQKQSGLSPTGLGWTEAGGSRSELLSELYVDGATTLDPNESVSLGNAYNTSVFGSADGDLEFQYALPGSLHSFGGVQYVTGTLSASAVPEPSALYMLVLSSLGACSCRRLR